jgi:short-subunit dehydrogenase
MIGGFTALRFLYLLVSFIYIPFRPSSLSRYNHSNAYALITGSSDGIGFAFAHELLSRGFNVILHGRNEKKLAGIKSDLLKQYPSRDVRYYISDAAKTGPESYAEMDAMLSSTKDLPITVLINNVGGMVGVSPLWKNLEDRAPADIEHVIALNSTYPTQMARALLPILKKNEPALILNISSLAAITSTPFITIYNGAKAYLVHWSHSLSCEMQATGSNIEVLLIEVGTTFTKGNPMTTGVSLFTPSARDMARSILQKVGSGKWKVVGYCGHAFQKYSLNWLPEWVIEKFIIAVAQMMKAEEEKKEKAQ